MIGSSGWETGGRHFLSWNGRIEFVRIRLDSFTMNRRIEIYIRTMIHTVLRINP